MEEEVAREEMPHGLVWRIVVSAIVCFAWLIFAIIFLFFYATDYGIYKTIAVLLVSILIVGAVLSPVWIPWGIRTARAEEAKRKRKSAE